MANTHAFLKSKSQYEGHFKKWGLRKYQKKEDWKNIGRKVAERKQAGKDSEVLKNNKIVPKATLQKQISRHSWVPTFEQNVRATSPQTPEGFEIRTPVAEDHALWPQLQDANILLPTSTGADDVLVTQLQIVSPLLPPGIGTMDFAHPQQQASTASSLPWMVTEDSFPSHLGDAIPFAPGILATDEFPFSPMEDVPAFFQRWVDTSNLPFFQLEASLHAQFSLALIPRKPQRPEFESSLETPSPLEYHQDTSFEVGELSHALLKEPGSPNAVFKALLPIAAQLGQAEEQLISMRYNHNSEFPELLTLLIFAMANDFAGLKCVPIQEIMVYLKRQTNTRLLQHVLSAPGPESEAFAESLFSAAIESEDARVVEVLIQKGLNPNDVCCTVDSTYRSEKYTPIERSSMLRNVEITTILLHAKVDVNKTYDRLFFWAKGASGALECAIEGVKRPHRASSKLVRILLDAGGKMSVQKLKSAVDQGAQEVSDLLVNSWVKSKPFDLIDNGVLELVIKSFDNKAAMRIVSDTLQASTDSTHDPSPKRLENLAGMLDNAAVRGNLELLQFLLHFGVSMTQETLAQAVNSRNKDLIRFLLDEGAEVDLCSLASAIYWGDVEIMTLLMNKGAWAQIGDDKRSKHAFAAAMVAASVTGQVDLVLKLLNLRPPNDDRRSLSNALVAAICTKQEAIIITLLDCGADASNGIFDPSDIHSEVREDISALSTLGSGPRGPPLDEALLQKNANLVRMILNVSVNIGSAANNGSAADGGFISISIAPLVQAVKWGNHSIIEELLAMGANPDSFTEISGEQCTALAVSIQQKDIKSRQLLLDAGADVNCIPRGSIRLTALKAAVRTGEMKAVDHIFSIGADPDDSQALVEALPQGMLMVEKLLTAFTTRYPHGKNEYGKEVLELATRREDFQLLERLLQAKVGVYPRSGDSSLLGVALCNWNRTSLGIFQRLVDESDNPNCIVNRSSHEQNTALLAAICLKDCQKVQLLLNAGADVNWPATRGVKRTPLQKAAEVGVLELVQLLLDNGALVNAPPAERGGATGLQLAAIGGFVGIAELLLIDGADANAPAARVYGRTALEGAAEYGRIDMLKLLINAGAIFCDSEYERARQFAKENGHMATWRYLATLYNESVWHS